MPERGTKKFKGVVEELERRLLRVTQVYMAELDGVTFDPLALHQMSTSTREFAQELLMFGANLWPAASHVPERNVIPFKSRAAATTAVVDTTAAISA